MDGLEAQSKQVAHWNVVLYSHRQRPAGRTSLTRVGREGLSVRVPYRTLQTRVKSKIMETLERKARQSDLPLRRLSIMSWVGGGKAGSGWVIY